MNKLIFGTLTFAGLVSLPAAALAATIGVATTNVNLRAGPSTGYPVVDVVPRGDEVRVFGCLNDRNWCDVRFDGLRGWMSSNYLAFFESGRRYSGPQAIYRMRAPVITFSFGSYWDNHYRSRNFYRDRGRWERYWRGDRDWDRSERREERRDDRRDWREERRDDRRDAREERRDDWREERRDGWGERRVERSDDRPAFVVPEEPREERRDDRTERRGERGDDRTERRGERGEDRAERSGERRGGDGDRDGRRRWEREEIR